jgi:hypothetical protein
MRLASDCAQLEFALSSILGPTGQLNNTITYPQNSKHLPLTVDPGSSGFKASVVD